MTVAELPRILVPSLAETLGISRSRLRTELRRGNWRTIARGAVLTRPEAPARSDWAALGIALAGPGAAVSGWDAIRARGLGTPRPPTDEVLVVTRRASNRTIGPLRVRETRRSYSADVLPHDATTLALLPIVSTQRAVADASLYYDLLAPVRAMVTSAVQWKLCSLPALVAELRESPRQHSALLRTALDDALDGARSVAEARCSERLTVAKLPRFELNVPVLAPDGTLLAVLDVFWRELRAALEVDSREYHFSEADWKKTMARHNMLTRRGLAITHYSPSIVCGRDRTWLHEIRCWLQDRADELNVPWQSGTGPIRPIGEPDPFAVGLPRRKAA